MRTQGLFLYCIDFASSEKCNHLEQQSLTFLAPWISSRGGRKRMVSCVQPRSSACTNEALCACLLLPWPTTQQACHPGVGDPCSRSQALQLLSHLFSQLAQPENNEKRLNSLDRWSTAQDLFWLDGQKLLNCEPILEIQCLTIMRVKIQAIRRTFYFSTSTAKNNLSLSPLQIGEKMKATYQGESRKKCYQNLVVPQLGTNVEKAKPIWKYTYFH